MREESMMHSLFLLLSAHCLCDYPLQGDFLSKGKNRRTNPFATWMPWYLCLIAHAFIHAGAVLLITNSLLCAFGELILHSVIDYLKCSGKFNAVIDQLLHLTCKILWVIL
jgi:hypothetical protein